MKKTLIVSAALALTAPVFAATTYTDATGEEFSGFGILDITSVEISNDATDVMFTINLSGDPIAADWGKYLVGIDSVPGGDTASNGWSRPISMSSGMDYWIGTWVDGGNGAETYSWGGASWNLDNATSSPPSDISTPTKTTSSVSFTTSLSSLGLGLGDTFTFDVFTAGGGGGDGANDALSDPNQTISDWGNSYNSSSTLTYTVVPEPGAVVLSLLGSMGLLFLRRRRR